MKILSWLILILILVCTTFKLGGAIVTGSTIGIALMIVLIALFSDLREFDFLGIKGKRREKEIKDLEGKRAISKTGKKISKKAVSETQEEIIQLMDTRQGNFLTLAFEIERLLRKYATVMLVKDIPSSTNINKLTEELHKQELVTESGVQQLKEIRWLRNILVHGRHSEINEATLVAGIDLAWSLYYELFNRLFPHQDQENK